MIGRRADGEPRAYRHVLRDNLPLVSFALISIVAAIFVGDALLRAPLDVFLVTAAIVAGPLALLWLVLVHPHVRWDTDEVVVTNIGRTHRMLWSRIVSVRQNLALSFELGDGKSVTAVAVAAPRDRGRIIRALSRGRLGFGSTEIHRHADALRSYHESQATRFDANAVDGPSGSVESRWDTVPLIVVGVLLLISALTAVIAF